MDDVQLIKDRIDVVTLISEYVPLKPAGANWKGVCPFHREKSPSFMAHREKQIWHCFGCGKGGDIFSFLQEAESMSFGEALRVLAERAGVTLTKQSGVERGGDRDERSRLREILTLSQHFFEKVLHESKAAQPARAYIERRGVTPETAAQFHLGYIPDGSVWTTLTDFLTKKRGYTLEECVAAGVTKKHTESGRYYDVFRGRVLFPIWDMQGGIVGFTGRLLQEQEGVGKYLNTPETVLFDKGHIVYALNLAKQAAKEAGFFVVVEGQMDVISCHQAGMRNVVAASGTALTAAHVAMLKRFAPQVRMAFDADAAGERAAKRGIDIAIEAGLDVRVIRIPEGAGKDPDECIKKDPKVWEQAVADSQPVFAYYIDRYVTPAVRKDPNQLRDAGELLARELARVRDPIVYDFWSQRIATALGVSGDAIANKVKQLQATAHPSAARAPSAPVQVTVAPAQPRTRYALLSEYVLCLLVHTPALHSRVPLDARWFFGEEDRALYNAIAGGYTHDRHDSVTAHRIDVLQLLSEEKLFAFSARELGEEYDAAVERLHQEWRAAERARLGSEIQRAQEQGDAALVAQLSQEFHQVTNL